MASYINTNAASLNSQNALTKSAMGLNTAMQRLSSGLRINSAKDDAAGLAISERMSAQIGGLNVATRNSNDGISLSQTTEGALSSISDSLQRIRELSVQSANNTNTDADRVSMQAEVSQLLSEIDRVATQTKFNGKTLLDGSLTNQQFQVGANSGETISFSVGSARTAKLGSSDAAAITTAQNAGSTALKEGAFTLNGVLIGPSLAAADTASTANAAASSIAKAAAVNAKSAESGVTATVNATENAGRSMSAAVLAGTATINGVSITINTTADAATSRASVVAAINAKQEQTGVMAVDTGDDKTGVKLVAGDGRNITLTLNTVTAAATGLGTTAGDGVAATFTGSITLNSDKAIAITSNLNGAAGTGGIKDAGLVVGTYAAQTAYASTTTAAPVVATSLTTFVAGDFTINGAQIGASVASADTASSANNASSGIAKAAAINKISEATGVTATVNATEVQGASMTAAALTGTLTINGVTTDSITTTTDAAASRRMVVDAINAKSGQTGVVATDTNDDTKGVTLSAADGRNIIMSAATLTSAATGLSADVMLAAGAEKIATSTLTLSSTKEFAIAAGSNAAGTTALNLKVGTYGAGRSGESLDKLDISTVEGANKALTAVDNALKTVNSARSEMGAVQNRFTAVVSNLQTTSENLTASRSRIKDADFATETANLSRGQILQQAGTAMLAQANQLPQGILALLR